MITPQMIAAARLLREAGFVVVKPSWNEDLAITGAEAIETSEHLQPADAAAHVYGAVLSIAAANTVRAFCELERDQDDAHDAVWKAMPEVAKIEF